MTIKTKLFANMFLTIAGILIIAGFSLGGMRFVQSKLAVLTEKSTPYQLKTIELQRAVQEHTSNLLKLAAATTAQELTAARGELEKTLADVKNLSTELSSFKGSNTADGAEKRHLDELASITAELVRTVDEKLKARDEAKKADTETKGKLQQIGQKLKEMDGAMKKLQKGSMGQLSTSNESVKQISQRVKIVQATMNSINDVKISLLEIAAAENKAGVTVARSHFTVASRWITTGALAKAEKDSAAVKSLIDGIGEITRQVTGAGGLIETKNALLATPTDDLRKQFSETNASAMQKLAQMTVLMGDQVEKAAETNTSENKRFEESLKGSESASTVMGMNSDLVGIGGDIRSLTKELFDADNPQELDTIRSELEQKFAQADGVRNRMRSGKKGQELRQLGQVTAALQEIRGLLLAKDGVVAKLKHSLEVTRQAQALNEKLKGVVAAQREEGKKGMSSAQQEQSKAVKSVNRVFKTSITSVTLIALAVLVLGIVFSTGLVRSITAPIKELTNISEKFGNGDFSSRLDEKRKDEFGTLAVHFNQATVKLKEITSQIRGAIGNLAHSANALTTTAEELSAGARQQATQTDQSASAMIEMSQTIQDVARNAHEAAAETKNTLLLAANGQKTVGETVRGMEEIASSVKETADTIRQLGENSARIGSVVDVINEIADQTNLLALNAAIEAARAGDAGMGFAVVADEVRKLAEKTAESTKEIAQMVAQIQANTSKSVVAMEKGTVKVEEGMQRATEANRSLDEIVNASDKGVAMVQTIATASEEQSAVAAEVSTSMEHIASITRAAETSTNDITRSAEELNRLAEDLNNMAAWFKV
ncbi:methyl-accepting chemotaxis protein [Geotalea toluenoxydans]|uniref:methyl-accepting chemotaxis protein n=1 Tax=Geotalea toluenoxydans TaxID=421624 RepID=UPI0006D07D3B|nr:methyl-accepting chemotaxis protein [Geotalea toluenoxydans]